jgi:hypothetical protein
MERILEGLGRLGHVGELARTLSPYESDPSASFTKTEIAQIARNTAGLGYRYPQPLPALNLALALGLIVRRNGELYLTELGTMLQSN